MKKQADMTTRQEDDMKDSDHWVRLDEYTFCRPCQNYSADPTVPLPLRHLRRYNFGIVSVQERFNENKSIKTHEQSELHKWCVSKEQKENLKKMEESAASTEAGEKVVRNAFMYFLNGWSSETFVSLNDKDVMTNGNNATKITPRICLYP